jgi:serine/threonine protein kinase
VRAIGEGATGIVWEAEHVELGRRVALKVLAWEHAASRASVERFRREARALAALSHPNLVQILDFGKSLDGRAFLAMELLVGETLDARLRRTPMDLVEATRVAIQACAALDAVHAAGLVHRDIKPQNLMLSRGGRVKLLDFGVAMATANHPADATGAAGRAKERALQGFAIFGTPEYMAPEQIAGEAVDQRADVYALGCVLYEMLVGTPPFEGSSVVVMGQQLRDTPKPMRSPLRRRQRPSRSEHASRQALESVAMRAMAKEPRARFPTAAAMSMALKEVLSAATRRRTQAPRLAQALLVSMGVCLLVGIAIQWIRTRASTSDGPTPIASVASPTSTAAQILPLGATAPVPTAAVVLSPTVAHTADPALARATTPAPRGAHLHTERARLTLPALVMEAGEHEIARR